MRRNNEKRRTDGRQNLFFGGLTTEPDVRKLMETYPRDKLLPDLVISYDEIEKLVGIQYGSSRWQSVTDRWRKTVQREFGIWLNFEEEDVGLCLRVLTNAGKLRYARRSERKIKRQLINIAKVVPVINRKELTDVEKGNLDGLIGRTNARLASEQMHGKGHKFPLITAGE